MYIYTILKTTHRADIDTPPLYFKILHYYVSHAQVTETHSPEYADTVSTWTYQQCRLKGVAAPRQMVVKNWKKSN